MTVVPCVVYLEHGKGVGAWAIRRRDGRLAWPLFETEAKARAAVWQ